MAKNSGITKGKSHKEGGIPMEVKSTGQKIEVEGGEGIVNKYAMSNTDTFKFDGKEKTSCEIISDLNQKKGDGVSFECDTVESKKYKYAKGGSLNFDSAETFYEAMEGVIEKGNEFIDKHEYKGDRHGKSKLAVNIKLYDVNYGIDAALDSYQSRRGNFDLEKEEYVKKDLRIDEEWTYKMYNDFLNDQVYFLVEDLLEKYGEVLEEKQIYQVGRMGGWLVFSDNGELNTNVDELENTLNNNFSEDGELVGYDRWGYDMEPVTFTEFKEEGDYDDALYYTKRINLLLDIYKEVAQDIKEAKDGVADSWKAHLDEKVEEHISENKKRFKIFTEDDPDFAKGGRLEGIPWNTVYTDEPFIQLDVDRKIGYIKALVERHNDKMNRYYDLAGEDGEHRSHSATKKIKQQAYNLESHIGGYIDAYNKLHPNQFKGGNITLSDFNLEYAKGGKVEVEVYYNEDGTPKGVWRKGYQGSNNMKKKIMSVPKLDWEKGKINSKNILNYAKGGDLYEYRSGNYEILIWETEEHREHLGPDRIFPKGTTDEEVISEAKGLFEDFAAVEVEKNGEVIYHISNDRPKGKRYAKGGIVTRARALAKKDGKDLDKVSDKEYMKYRMIAQEEVLGGKNYAKGGKVKTSDGSFLWFFNWNEGGFNQVYAKTKAQAIKKATENGYPSYMPDNQYSIKTSLQDVKEKYGKKAVDYIINEVSTNGNWSNNDQKRYYPKLTLKSVGFSSGLTPNKSTFRKQSAEDSRRTDEMANRMTMEKGGEVKKKENNEMLIGGIAGILLGIFLGRR